MNRKEVLKNLSKLILKDFDGAVIIVQTRRTEGYNENQMLTVGKDVVFKDKKDIYNALLDFYDYIEEISYRGDSYFIKGKNSLDELVLTTIYEEIESEVVLDSRDYQDTETMEALHLEILDIIEEAFEDKFEHKPYLLMMMEGKSRIHSAGPNFTSPEKVLEVLLNEFDYFMINQNEFEELEFLAYKKNRPIKISLVASI